MGAALGWLRCETAVAKWTNTPDPPSPHTTVYPSIASFEAALADSISWSFEYAGFDEEEGKIVPHPEHRYLFLSGGEALCREKNILLNLVKSGVRGSEYR